jgi:hypothetical protein
VDHRHLTVASIRGRHLMGLDAVNAIELFGVDDHAAIFKGYAPTGKSGAPAPGNHLEAGFGNGPDQRRHLGFAGGTDHSQRQAKAPVGGIGHMGV